MIEQLNVTNAQKLNAELSSGSNRLQSLVPVGETRSAQVVAVVAQPVRSATPAGSEAQATRTPAATPATTDSSRAGTTENRAATSPQSQDAAAGYRIRLQLQGQLIELVASRPLPVGTTVALTRTTAQQVQLQLPAQSGAQSSSGNPTAAGSAASARSGATPQPTPATNTSADSVGAKAQPAATQAAQLEQLARLLPTPHQAVAARVLQSQPGPQGSVAPPAPATPAGSTPANPVASAALSDPRRALSSAVAARSAATPPASPSAPSAGATTAPGGTLAALPGSTGAAGAPLHRVQLSVAGQLLEVSSPRPIAAGTEVKLSRTADGQLSLQLPAPRALAVENALRQHLPQQRPPDELFNALSQISSQAPLRQSQPLLMNLITLLLGRTLSNPAQPDPDGVRQQLQQGGTLLEGKLARGETQTLPQDQKALLLKLAHQLQQPPSRELPASVSERLSLLTQQAVSRVITNQIHSLGQAQAQDGDADTPVRALVVDLPVQGQQGQHEHVQLRISEQRAGSHEQAEQSRRWQVELAFEMQQMPPFQAVLTLEQGAVSVIWRGQSGVRSLLQPHLGALQQRLESLGLEVGVIGIHEGTATPGAGNHRSLIDVTT